MSSSRKLKAETEKSYGMDDLIEMMRRLREPGKGCPWDLEQNFTSIAPYTIEEAYEVADAIERSDMLDLREELGDLLLQPVYHSQMASESGDFTIQDVIHDITAKMIARHPHVFGNRDAQKPEDVDKIWDEKKAQEKPKDSALDGVTKGLPALLRAYKLQNKAAKVGFEWNDMEGVLDKFEEELAEMRDAYKNGTIAEKTDELGDLLFVLVNFGRMLGINAETALRQCNYKFERRFKGMESDFKSDGKNIREMTLKQMEEKWRDQKKKEV